MRISITALPPENDYIPIGYIIYLILCLAGIIMGLILMMMD